MSIDYTDDGLEERARDAYGNGAWNDTQDDASPPATPVGFQALFVERPPPPPVLLPGVIPIDAYSLVGPGGLAKTTLTQHMQVRCILGGRLFNIPLLRHGPAVIISAEDTRDVLMYRLRELCDAMELTREEQKIVAANYYIEDVVGRVARLVESDGHGNLILTGMADYIIRRYSDIRPVHIAMDPAIYFGPGERYINDAEAMVMQAGRKMSRALSAAVQFTHHVGKQSAREGTIDQYAGRGGSAGADNSRGVLVLAREGERDSQWPRPPEITDEDVADDRVFRIHVPKFSPGKREQRPIWVRRGASNPWRFSVHFPPDRAHQEEAERQRRAERAEANVWRLARFIHGETIEHTSNSLETRLEQVKMSRADLRAAIYRGLQTQTFEHREPTRPRHGGGKILSLTALAVERIRGGE